MTKTLEQIIFFGSGPVAAESLESLSESFTIVAVVTKPLHHGHKGIAPVIEVAKKLSINIYTVNDKHEVIDLFNTNLKASRVGVLVDFGIIISPDVINKFKLGIINSHFSILPEWRGADPITFSILSGQQVTGVSLMLIAEKMDEGPILSARELNIPRDIYIDELTKKLTKISNSLLNDTLPLYLEGKISPTPQSELIKPSYSRKIVKADGKIDWNKPADAIEREIRAFASWPKSYTSINGIDLIITKAEVVTISGRAGLPMNLNNNLVICCGDKSLLILKLKPSGKNEMTSMAFLAGYKNLIFN